MGQQGVQTEGAPPQAHVHTQENFPGLTCRLEILRSVDK